MNKFPEGLKFFIDPRKKKLKENNARCIKRNVEQENKNPHITPEVLQNCCFYCAKVFINSNYLLKHIFRRHSDEVVKFHKKILQSDPSDLKSLFTFLETEFSELKNEIFAVKQAMGLESFKRDEREEILKTCKEADCFPGKVVESSGGVILTDSRSKEVQNLENKLNNIEDKVQLLCDKLEENDKNINSKFLLKQDVHQFMTHKEEKILRKQEAQFIEMRQVLIAELKIVIDKQLHENNIDWNAKMTELKDDILKLDQAVVAIRKQVNSPDYLQAVERNLESQIFHFLNNIGQTAMKKKSMKPKTNYSPKIQVLENGSSDSQVSLKRNLLHLNHSQEKTTNNSNMTPEMLRALIAEKLSSFGIFSSTSRLSNSEYEEKLRLVNTNKDYLKMLYHNFSEVYNCVNISVDQRVLSKLKPKQKRKLRFSEPLVLNKEKLSSLLSNKTDFLNKTCPVLKEEINDSDIDKPFRSPKPAVAVPSEGFNFQDDSGSGDCCDKFQENYRNHTKEMFDTTEGKRFYTSSPVIEANSGKKSRKTSQNSSFVEFNKLSSEEKNIRCVAPAKSASDIIFDDDTCLNETYVKYYNDKADGWDKISEIEDEEESLKSLSSLEDDSFANNPIK